MLGSVALQVPMTWLATRSESPKHLSRLTAISLAVHIPWRSASYSATLLVQGSKLICSAYLSLSPFGDVRTMPEPEPSWHLDPSKWRVQSCLSCRGFGELRLFPVDEEVYE